MRYSELYGYKISKLTLGTVALGMSYGISNENGKPERTNSLALISSAIKEGINTLDTARTYGEAEQLIGEFLEKSTANSSVNVVSKFKISPENLNNKDKARAEIFNSVRTSARSLNVSVLPIGLFHMNRNLPMDKVLKILPQIITELKDEGLIDLAGVSIDHPDEAKLFLDHMEFEAVQVPVNLFDRRVIENGMIDRMHAEGKIVFARSVFLQGLFFMNPLGLRGNLRKAAPYIEALQRMAKETNRSIAELAFSFVNGLKGVTSIVFGAVNQDQVKENIRLSQTIGINNQVRNLIKSCFDGIPEQVITPGLWSFI
ncbi:MAG TPA: aldo/keto reductase [Hanamia sp.]|nr:aldo/keto reductase [Hanamia sp.]